MISQLLLAERHLTQIDSIKSLLRQKEQQLQDEHVKQLGQLNAIYRTAIVADQTATPK